MEGIVEDYADKIAYSCFGEYEKGHESCKGCCEIEICEIVTLLILQKVKIENENLELIEVLKERHGVWYKKDCAHIFDIPRCMCRKCIIERCDNIIGGSTKC